MKFCKLQARMNYKYSILSNVFEILVKKFNKALKTCIKNKQQQQPWGAPFRMKNLQCNEFQECWGLWKREVQIIPVEHSLHCCSTAYWVNKSSSKFWAIYSSIYLWYNCFSGFKLTAAQLLFRVITRVIFLECVLIIISLL